MAIIVINRFLVVEFCDLDVPSKYKQMKCELKKERKPMHKHNFGLQGCVCEFKESAVVLSSYQPDCNKGVERW